MTIGPEPKPIRTGATLHTVCITEGPLSTYKLFARVYGGKSDQDINVHNVHTVTKLKMVSLYNFMLESFKHKGHCVVMDSAYMGDAMCQVGREEWGINMVGTCQTDRTGAGALGKLAVKAKEIVIGCHECLLYQHNTKPLLYCVWGDNNFVKTLSNFHSPVILRGGMRRKTRNRQTNRREREKSDVDCSEQQKDYCNTYHKIDKGNGFEAKYDLSIESHLHGWPPKLAARFFNMNINNTNKVFVFLYMKYHPGQVVMPVREGIHNLTHSLLQKGDDMRQRKCGPPPSATKDITTSSSQEGRKVRTDSVRQSYIPDVGAHGTGAVHARVPQPIDYSSPRGRHYQQCAFSRRRLLHPWRVHQPVPMLVRGLDNKGSGPRCQYKKCLGFEQDAVTRVSFKTIYRCEECSMNKNTDVWLCHTTKKLNGQQTIVSCHLKYHTEMCFETTDSATESAVDSELTEE